MKITYKSSRFEIGGKVVETPWAIREAFVVKGNVVVLMDQFENFKGPVLDIQEVRRSPKGTNLFCYSQDGVVLWKAELPVDNVEDYYYRISSHLPLVANSFSSYRCEIDLTTGKIMRKDFFK